MGVLDILRRTNKKDNGDIIQCSLTDLQNRIHFILSLAADVKKLKSKEPYLSPEEKRALRMMEQDLKLWIDDTNKKCFGYDKITLQDVYSELEKEPDLLEKIAESSLSLISKKNENSESNQ